MSASTVMFLNWVVMAALYFSTMRALKAERTKNARLRQEKVDLMDEVHHLKVKYGELPILNFVMGSEEDVYEEERP